MAIKTFIDTNILVYSVDRADPVKQEIALGWIAKLAKEKCGLISTQVLQEFYSAATRKLGIEPMIARQQVRGFQVFDIVVVTPEIIEEGIDCSIASQLSFWDGLIVASAACTKCKELLSEDMGDGQVLNGCRVRNPFRESSQGT